MTNTIELTADDVDALPSAQAPVQSTGGVTIDEGTNTGDPNQAGAEFYSPADASVPVQRSGPSQYTPAYQRDAVQNVRTQSAPPLAGSPDTVAYVSDADPNTIKVAQPSNFTEKDEVHEQTHTYQDTRDPAFLNSLPAPSSDPTKRYGYGGVQGLENERAAGHTIANASVEQQAKIQEDWTRQEAYYADKASKGQLSRKDAEDYDRAKAAYGWAIGQLAAVPAKGKVGNTIDTTPKAPGPPPLSASGILTDIPENGRPSVMDKNLMAHPMGGGKPVTLHPDDLDNMPPAKTRKEGQGKEK